MYNDCLFGEVVLICLFIGGLLTHCPFEGGVYLMGRVIFPSSRPTRGHSFWFWACMAFIILTFISKNLRGRHVSCCHAKFTCTSSIFWNVEIFTLDKSNSYNYKIYWIELKKKEILVKCRKLKIKDTYPNWVRDKSFSILLLHFGHSLNDVSFILKNAAND